MKKIISFLWVLLLLTSCATSTKTTQVKKASSNTITLANGVVIKGGDGSSFEKAKIIIAKNSMIGIRSEYNYLSKVYGKRGIDWNLIQQSLNYHKKKPYNVLKIKLIKTNKELEVYFEISSFFGKF